jgi:hypothetical protein|nr:MAG TPA: Mind bomb SH3 repeat domain [Caudoviricetes sp.]
MPITRFKVGDKVRVRKGLKINHWYGNYLYSRFMTTLVDEVDTVTGICGDDNAYLLNHYDIGWTDEMLEPAEKTLYNLEKGDIVSFDNNGEKCKVLAVIDNCYLLSYPTDFTSAGFWYTVDDLKHLECTIQQPEIGTIEVNGKKYKKADVEKAIKDLEAVE